MKDFSRLLTLCFCCRCCCIVRSEMRHLITAYPKSLIPMEGVRVEVEEECVGCGECVPVCPIGNVSLVDGRAVIGEMCLACGTCARTCERRNIKVSISQDVPVQKEMRRRIEAGVDIER